MPYIKKLVMHGFKSFARRTEIVFENDMNVIVGPNGSGKSNIADALCFVLGRLSIKSIRAAKAANLLFSGNQSYKASKEASVELVFDNSDKGFAVDSNEVMIKRIVHRSGQSVYKMNNETKTRQELLELLAQAGIDPNGFNIVLQGEISSLVKSRPEERRKIIEEVAGISIYEMRKGKSLRELEKTDERLKEVWAVLKERQMYLRNLEKERQEALNYKKLEETINRCKATILSKGIEDKKKEILEIVKGTETHEKEINKVKKEINKKNAEVENLQEKIDKVNKDIHTATGNEQEILHKVVAELKADVAGLEVRKENFERRVQEGKDKQIEMKQKLEEIEIEISEAKSAKPESKKKRGELKELQEKVDELEKKRRRFYIVKSKLASLEDWKISKQRVLIEGEKEIEMIEENMEVVK